MEEKASSTSTNFLSQQNETHENSGVYKSFKRGLAFEESWDQEQRPSKFQVNITNESELIIRKVRSVLNKLTPVNFNGLRKRFLNLIPNEAKQISDLMQFLVTKAMDDPMYLKLYARLVGYTISRKPSNISHFIRTILSSKIHQELQRLATDMELAKFNHSVEREDISKRKKIMLHRFIAELFVEDVCTLKFLAERVTDLIDQGKRNIAEADEPLECLCVVFTFAGAKLEETNQDWLNGIFVQLNLREAVKSPIISKRIQFMLLDMIEMRSKGWVPHNKWWTPSVSFGNDTADQRMQRRSTRQHQEHAADSSGIMNGLKSLDISKQN